MTNEIIFAPGSSVVAYLRDSGGQAQDFSINQQKEAIRKWAAENRVKISHFFVDEARPGTSIAGRKAFLQMIDYFRQDKIKESGLVLWSYSRFARDINSAMRYKSEIRSYGYKIYSLTDKIPEGEDGILFEFLNDWSNDKFSKRNAIEATRGLHYNMDNFGCIGGTPPKGFKRKKILIGQHRNGGKRYASRWVPDPTTWETCKLAWQMRADGQTYREINKVCHLFGAINSYNTFYKNELYLGILHFGDQVITDYVEPMIDMATWEKVQRQFSQKNDPRISDGHPRRAKSNFYLSGLAYCARCGAPLNGNTVKFGDADKPYFYYICSRAGQRHECDALRIPKEPLEEEIYVKLTQYMLEPTMVYERQKALLAEHDAQNEESSQLKKELKKRLGEKETSIKNITSAIELGHGKQASLLDRLDELERSKRELTDQLDMIAAAAAADDQISPEEARKRAREIYAVLQRKNPEEIKRIFRGLIHKIEVERDGHLIRGSIEFYGPPPATDTILRASQKIERPAELLEFMPMSQCPHRDGYHTHKIYQIGFEVNKKRAHQ